MLKKTAEKVISSYNKTSYYAHMNYRLIVKLKIMKEHGGDVLCGL